MKTLFLIMTVLSWSFNDEQKVRQDDLSKKLLKIQNDSIRWDGTYFGMMPFIDFDLINECKQNSDQKWFLQAMLKKLSDEKSFAVAHIILLHSVDTGLKGNFDG